MSQEMYDFISKHMSEFNIDTENGLIITPKGTNGTVCTSTGYLRFKHKGKLLQVHQVLAVKYFGRECIGKQINHINGDKLINIKENLEAITQQENIKHQFATGLEGTSKKVMMFDMQNNHIKTFDSTKQASEDTGISIEGIRRVARGYQYSRGKKVKSHSIHGYKWKYVQ